MPDPTYITFLPLAKKIIRDSSVGMDRLRGTDYGEFAQEETLSLAYLLAESAKRRLEELR